MPINVFVSWRRVNSLGFWLEFYWDGCAVVVSELDALFPERTSDDGERLFFVFDERYQGVSVDAEVSKICWLVRFVQQFC